MAEKTNGKVYILTNDLMPGVIKIGITEGKVEDRIKSLDNTSIPLPFRFYFAIETPRFKEIELLAHNAFAAFRIRESREFFQVDPERAVAALKISGAAEVKIKNEMIDEKGTVIDEPKMSDKPRKKRTSFEALGIALGSELLFTRDENKKCTVSGDSEVQYEGTKYSLTGLADKLMRELGYNWASIQGPAFFEYNGKTLTQMRKELDAENMEEETEDVIAL